MNEATTPEFRTKDIVVNYRDGESKEFEARGFDIIGNVYSFRVAHTEPQPIGTAENRLEIHKSNVKCVHIVSDGTCGTNSNYMVHVAIKYDNHGMNFSGVDSFKRIGNEYVLTTNDGAKYLFPVDVVRDYYSNVPNEPRENDNHVIVF